MCSGAWVYSWYRHSHPGTRPRIWGRGLREGGAHLPFPPPSPLPLLPSHPPLPSPGADLGRDANKGTRRRWFWVQPSPGRTPGYSRPVVQYIPGVRGTFKYPGPLCSRFLAQGHTSFEPMPPGRKG